MRTHVLPTVVGALLAAAPCPWLLRTTRRGSRRPAGWPASWCRPWAAGCRRRSRKAGRSGDRVCTNVAPMIAGELSRQNGVRVTRVSLRVRNPCSARRTRGSRRAAVLRGRLAKGEAADKLEFAETVSEPAGKSFRYMKALPVQPVCVNCHRRRGQPRAGDQGAHRPRIPADRATGYLPGQIRGAVSVKRPL